MKDDHFYLFSEYFRENFYILRYFDFFLCLLCRKKYFFYHKFSKGGGVEGIMQCLENFFLYLIDFLHYVKGYGWE